MLRLFRGLNTQITVIHALVLRETRTRFGDNKLGYFWAFFEPIAVIVTFYFAFDFGGFQPPVGMDLVAFIATGLLPYELVTNTSEKTAEAINGNRAMLYYPQVHPLDTIFSRALLEAATLITVFGLIMAAHAFATRSMAIDDVLGVVAGLTLCSLLGTSLGLVFCVLGVVTNFLDRIRGTLMRPLFWISGVFFTAESLPRGLRDVALYNPILHAVELVRGAWFRSYDAKHASAAYVIGWILVLMVSGLLIERRVRHRIEVG